MGIFSQLFGKKKRLLLEAISNGATIIDVRTLEEFNSGNVEGSINLPLDKLTSSIDKLKKISTPIIVCCATGMRSSLARKLLIKNGIKDVYNGGSWNRVRKLVNTPD